MLAGLAGSDAAGVAWPAQGGPQAQVRLHGLGGAPTTRSEQRLAGLVLEACVISEDVLYAIRL